MKFTFLKFKKNNLPSPSFLRPPIFDAERFWFASLGLCLVVLLITGLIGFKLLYSQYFESYKESVSTESYENIINISKLKNVIEKRNDFVNRQTSLPEDPSL